jgi:hypothetical protein
MVSFEAVQTAGQVAICAYVTPDGRGRGRPVWSEVSEPSNRRWWIALLSFLQQSLAMGSCLSRRIAMSTEIWEIRPYQVRRSRHGA